MRVLICRSNPIAPDPRVEKIGVALARGGYSVTMLGWDRSAEMPERTVEVRQGKEITIYRLGIKAPFGHGLANLPNLVRWQLGLFGWLRRHRGEFDLVHACDFDTILPALACKWLWGKKVIYDIFDFYADHLRATPAVIKRLIRAVDLRAIGWADGLILADDSRWEQIAGARPRHSAVIYNSPSVPEHWELVEAERQSEAAGQDGVRLRVAYIGLLQVERGLVEMVEVLGRHPEWRLDLAGFGGDEGLIRSKCEGMANCRWHGRVAYERALQLSEAADVLFATYDPAIPNHRYSSPNKVFEAMLLGKPILVARDTHMDRIIQEADCGMVLEYGNVGELEAALGELERDAELRLRLGQNGRRAYQTTYSWGEMEKRLAKLYGEVLGGRSDDGAQ